MTFKSMASVALITGFSFVIGFVTNVFLVLDTHDASVQPAPALTRVGLKSDAVALVKFERDVGLEATKEGCDWVFRVNGDIIYQNGVLDISRLSQYTGDMPMHRVELMGYRLINHYESDNTSCRTRI